MSPNSPNSVKTQNGQRRASRQLRLSGKCRDCTGNVSWYNKGIMI